MSRALERQTRDEQKDITTSMRLSLGESSQKILSPSSIEFQNNTMSFSGFPIEVVGVILSFVNEPETLCAISCTSRQHASFVQENDATLWKDLYHHRWKRGQYPHETILWRDACRVRSRKDALAIRYVNNLSANMSLYREDTRSVLALAPVWEPDEDTWSVLMQLGVDVLECCLRMYQHVMADLSTASFRDKCTAYVSALSAYHLELAECFHEFHTLGKQTIDQDVLLEKYAILIAKGHQTMNEFLAQQGATSVESEVTKQLDVLAAAFQARLDSATISNSDSDAAVSLLTEHLAFGEWGFRVTGNGTSSNSHKEVLVNHVLCEKASDSLTMAILLKSICRRVGIQVDVIHHRGRTLLGIPDENTSNPYEVLFNMTHEFISPEDCRKIVAMHDRSQCTPLLLTQTLIVKLNCRFQSTKERSLLPRNNGLWRAVLPTHPFSIQDPFVDPSEIAYEACPELAVHMDGGMLL